MALGLVLLVLAALLALGVALPNTEPANAEAFGVTLANVSVGGIFLAGMATGAVAALGLFLVLGGAARKRHKSVATKRKVRSATNEAETLAEENARLRSELEHRPYPGDDAHADSTRVSEHGR